MGDLGDNSDCTSLEYDYEIGQNDNLVIEFPCEIPEEYVGEEIEMWIQIVGEDSNGRLERTIDGRLIDVVASSDETNIFLGVKRFAPGLSLWEKVKNWFG